MSKNLTVVPRISMDERTVAVVQWRGTIPEHELRQSVTNAVTEWVNTTEEGKEAWQSSSEDFNIGDLSVHLAGEDTWEEDALARCLRNHGITWLEVECYSDTNGDVDWTYDTVLVDDLALNEEEDEDHEAVEDQVP